MGERSFFTWAGSAVAAGGFALFHETLAWAWNKSLDGLSAHIPELAPMIGAIQGVDTWHVVGAIAIVCGIALVVYARIKRPTPQLAFHAVPEARQVPSAPVVPALPVERTLSDAMVYAGSLGMPGYRARFNRSGRDANFFVEYSAFMGLWTERVTVPLLQVQRFVKGQTIVSDIVSQTVIGDEILWHFGSETTNGVPRHIIGPGQYRGRVTMLTENDTVEHCYFIAQISDKTKMPAILGEHLWSHEHEWEGRLPPRGDAESLFT